MFKWLKRGIQQLKVKRNPDGPKEYARQERLNSSLSRNIRVILDCVGHSPDIVSRRLVIGGEDPQEVGVLFIDGLVDQIMINDHILTPLVETNQILWRDSAFDGTTLKNYLLAVGEVREVRTIPECIEAILAGDTLLLLAQESTGLAIATKGWEKRSIDEPDTEVIIKGPREGFIENLRTNTMLLRRRINNSDLRFENLLIGQETRTKVCLAYLRGIVNDTIVAEVRRRLRAIQVDGVLSAGMIEQLVEDAPFSPFSTVGYTERPDVCAAKLLEGRVAIFVDGTPVVNTVPYLFIESFQSPDDYNFRPFFATLIRGLRYMAFIISILLPALYVALSTYHHEFIPTSLLISMAAAAEGTPFPAFLEALGMGIIFELLREAGIRLPRSIGQAVSIMGALVIGEATVTAGLIGAPLVIVVALTAIASFLIPTQVEASVLIRLGLTLVAGILGAYGVVLGLIIMYIHLASLRSLGVPYFSPLAPLIVTDLKDVVIRMPLWMMDKRPRLIGGVDRVRQKREQMPLPPKEDP